MIRVCRYPLLLKSLLKSCPNTPAEAEDQFASIQWSQYYSTIQSAHQKMNDVVSLIDQVLLKGSWFIILSVFPFNLDNNISSIYLLKQRKHSVQQIHRVAQISERLVGAPKVQIDIQI